MKELESVAIGCFEANSTPGDVCPTRLSPDEASDEIPLWLVHVKPRDSLQRHHCPELPEAIVKVMSKHSFGWKASGYSPGTLSRSYRSHFF
jgi:hypothetical protein